MSDLGCLDGAYDLRDRTEEARPSAAGGDVTATATRPLSIVHAAAFFDPATRFGGPVTQLRRVCAGLADRGHRVTVVTSDLDVGPGVPRERWVERDGYRVWYGRVGRLGTFAPYHAPRLRRPLTEALAGADVLHLALSFTHVNLLARRAAGAAGVPYAYSPRSCLDPVRLRQRRWSKAAFLHLFERAIIRDAAVVHALTGAEREQALRQGARPGQVTVVPNACELGPDTAWPDGAGFRRRFSLPAGAPLVLFLGRLQTIKGLDLLVDVFARARPAAPSAQLVLAGPDEGGAAIVARAARRLGVADAVHVVGAVDGRLRLAALRAADVFALTSRSEGMPNAVLEACAAGTAVLVTDRCQLPEIAEDGAGCVEPADAGRLAVALRGLLEDPGRRRAMGQAGTRMVAERFALPRVVAGLEAMYTRMAEGGAGGKGGPP